MLLLSYWKRTAQFVPRCRAKHSHPHRHTVAVRRQICIFKSKRYLSAFADILRHFQRSQFDNLIIIPLNRAFSFHISRLSSPAVTLQSHFSLRHPRVLVSICAMEWQEQSGTQAISCEHKMDNLILFFFFAQFFILLLNGDKMKMPKMSAVDSIMQYSACDAILWWQQWRTATGRNRIIAGNAGAWTTTKPTDNNKKCIAIATNERNILAIY